MTVYVSYKKRFSIIVFLAFMGSLTGCAENGNESKMHNWGEKITKINAQYTMNETALINAIGDPEVSIDDKIHIVNMAGSMRLEKAVPVLLKNLTIIAHDFSEEPSPEGEFVCALALIKIGKPASLAIIQQLSEDMADLRRDLILRIIRRIEGEAVGKFMLELAITESTSKAGKENLEKSLKLFFEHLTWESKAKKTGTRFEVPSAHVG